MMEKYTPQQRAKVVEFFSAKKHSIVETQRAYRSHFNTVHCPSRSAISRIIQRFRSQGSVTDLPRSGRPRTIQNVATIDLVKSSVAENATVSTRQRASQLGLSRTSLRRLMKDDLHLFPYKIQLVQELKPLDAEKRLEYAIKLQDYVRKNKNFIDTLIMSDEAHFHLNGFVNKQNCRIWASENPRCVLQRQTYPLRCTVWCGVTSARIIGPYFFENQYDHAVSVTGDRYRTMIENFLVPAVANTPLMWFQQDGATVHTARASIDLLRKTFGERIISRNADFSWPPRSPDLTAPDYFLWGYLKDRVYANKPNTIEALKHNIAHEVRAIQPEILKKVMEHAVKRAVLCQEENGGHLRDLIFSNAFVKKM